MKRSLCSAAVALLITTSLPAHGQDAAAGKRVFNKCIACHAVGPTATNKVGPELNGLFGRPAGSVPGFAYSLANKQSGITWDEETFAHYIANPQTVVKGTKMAFAGLKNPQEVKDVIAYLSTFAADGSTKQQ
ncbi:MAG: cytochrome C [Kaistia sp. SCN 65-12]|jgi:cytochrome c|nr:MAG: cytochrome C [Kaistia sp. SCN 65-12]